MIAHLLVRERSVFAAAGIAIKPLAGHTDRVRQKLRDEVPFAELVDRFRGEPPKWSVINWGPVDDLTNAIEYFVHTEDVRRAAVDWKPRIIDPKLQDALWRRLVRGSRIYLRGFRGTVELRRADTGEVVRTGSSDAAADVEVTGLPGELLMFASNRKDHADVQLTGDPDAIARLRATRLGWF